MRCRYCGNETRTNEDVCRACKETIRHVRDSKDQKKAEIYGEKQNGGTRKSLFLGVFVLIAAAALVTLIVTVVVPALKSRPSPVNTDDETSAIGFDISRPAEISYAETAVGVVLEVSNVSKERKFGADRAIDGDGETCWCVNPEYKDQKLTIRFYLNGKTDVIGFGIINGNQYLPEEGLYNSNGQIEQFTVKTGDHEYSFVAEKNNGNKDFVQYFKLPDVCSADAIELIVDTTYENSFGNVCLTEFFVYQGK